MPSRRPPYHGTSQAIGRNWSQRIWLKIWRFRSTNLPLIATTGLHKGSILAVRVTPAKGMSDGRNELALAFSASTRRQPPGAWLAHTARWLSTARTACPSCEALGFQISVTSSVIGVSEVVVRFGM